MSDDSQTNSDEPTRPSLTEGISEDDTFIHFPSDTKVSEVEDLRRELVVLNVYLTQVLPELTDGIHRLSTESVTRSESKRRTKIAVGSVLLATLLGILGSMFITLGVVLPTCFFRGSIAEVNRIGGPLYCSIIPGYDKNIVNIKNSTNAILQNQSALKQTTIDNRNAAAAAKILAAETHKKQLINENRINLLEREVISLESRLHVPVSLQVTRLPGQH
jgi:hypothetical protein